MRLKQWIMVGGLILSGLPLVAEAASTETRPRSRPATLSVSAAAAQAAAPQQVAVQQVAGVSDLRPKARTAALARQFERRAAQQTARAEVQPAVARVSTMTLTPRHGAISESRRAHAMHQAAAKRSKGQRVWCVPFARDLSGVAIQGNAHTWWNKAAGVYARSHTPAVGSVMNFKSTRKMRLGHVAVVSKVESPRRILIDHANWQRNKISTGMAVIDVSKNNDWSQVRVENGPGGFGAIYPVAGFIHPSRS